MMGIKGGNSIHAKDIVQDMLVYDIVGYEPQVLHKPVSPN